MIEIGDLIVYRPRAETSRCVKTFKIFRENKKLRDKVSCGIVVEDNTKFDFTRTTERSLDILFDNGHFKVNLEDIEIISKWYIGHTQR